MTLRSELWILLSVLTVIPCSQAEPLSVTPTSSHVRGTEEPIKDQKSATDQPNYLLPAGEILGFQFLLNQFDRHFQSDKEAYQTNGHTIRHNFHRGFGFDRDEFTINQVGHPYQGSIYYGFARAAGLNFWESTAYTAAGSFLWEEAGETTRPSTNDQVTTTFGGAFLGESLVRMAKLFWEDGSPQSVAIDDLDAAIASPPVAIDKFAFGHTADANPPNKRPLVSSMLRLGVLENNHVSPASEDEAVADTVAAANFEMDYGIPGQPGYTYKRPFDYFSFKGAIDSNQGDAVESLFVHGLLYGEKFSHRDEFDGIYGLYGTYDYMAPGLFREGSTGLALGTTGVWRLDRNLTLEGIALGGAAFGAAGTIHSTDGNHDYHYGAVPEGSMNLRLLMGDRAALDLTGREFYVIGSGSRESGSNDENIARFEASLTYRLYGPNALSITYGSSWRSAAREADPDQHQQVETFGLFYTYLANGHLGALPRQVAP